MSYMPYVTNNVNTFVQGQTNEVACVYCKKVYETKYSKTYHNCLWCKDCGIDALMVVSHSPLVNLSEEERMALLEKWHEEGFTPIPIEKKN
jgi:hypothetical protein